MDKRNILLRGISFLLILCFIFLSCQSNLAQAADNFKIYDYLTKKTQKKANDSLTYVINEKTLNLKNTPPFLTENGVALAPYNAVFKKTLGVKTSYHSFSKKITMKYNNTEIIMMVGSKTAKVNGKSVEMNAAPMRIQYKDSNVITTVVPSRFVAETLGFYYNWDSKTSTIIINSPLLLRYNGQDISYTGIKAQVQVDQKQVNLAEAPSILIGDTLMLRAKKVFQKQIGADYQYKSKKIILQLDQIKLEMQIGSKEAFINGAAVTLPEAPLSIQFKNNDTSYIYVPGKFTANALGYEYDFQDTKQLSTITTTKSSGKTPLELELEEEPEILPEDSDLYFSYLLNDEKKEEIEEASIAAIEDYFAVSSSAASILESVELLPTDELQETYLLKFNSSPGNITHTKEKDQVTFFIQGTETTEHTTIVTSRLISSVETTQVTNPLLTQVTFSLNAEFYTCDAKMSESGLEYQITFYPNYLVEASAGKNSTGEFLKLTGSLFAKADIVETGNELLITIPNTVAGIEKNLYEGGDTELLSFCKITQNENDVVIQLTKPISRPFYQVKYNEKSCILLFTAQADGTDIPLGSAIFIPLPKEIDAAQITDQDLYYSRQFQLILPGDYTEFYKNNPIVNTYKEVLDIKITATSSKTILTFYTSLVRGYRYEEVTDGLSLTVAHPREIYSKIVVLDAGHGGTDPGTVHGGYNEKDLNFSVLWDYAKPYFEASDIKAYFSRYNDTLVPLETRAAYAAEVGADFFVSLHHNSSTNTAAAGTNIYYSTIHNPIGPGGLTSKTLASIYVRGLTDALGTQNRGIIDKGFVVVRDNSVPSVLLELGFMSNKFELALMTSSAFQEKAGKAIYDIAQSVFTAYPTGR